MGCIGKFILTALALWGFSLAGWITIAPGVSLLWVALLVMLIAGVVDLLLILVNLLVQVIAIPLSILTGGVLSMAIEGAFKYAGLFVASYLTGLFTLPWIFGPLWWQALIIGFAFAVIGFLSASGSSKSSGD